MIHMTCKNRFRATRYYVSVDVGVGKVSELIVKTITGTITKSVTIIVDVVGVIL